MLDSQPSGAEARTGNRSESRNGNWKGKNVQGTTTEACACTAIDDGKEQWEIKLNPSTSDPINRSIYPRAGRAASPLSLHDLFLPPPTRPCPLHVQVPISAGQGGPWGFWSTQWHRHKAPMLVFAAQLFGALMNLGARLLELGEVDGELHPMQLLFWRMLLTAFMCTAYICRRRITHGVLGDPKVRWLLVARSIVGFFGIYGMWFSMQYLPLAEATVIQFLAPTLAGYWCHTILGDPYTRTDKLASVLALAGVVLVTKPTTLFPSSVHRDTELNAIANTTAELITRAPTVSEAEIVAMGNTHAPTSSERLCAIAMSLVGVLGGSFAYTTLRAIGKRAHSFVSVNYFSMSCVLVTFAVLSLAPLLNIGQPDLRLALPSSVRQWGLLFFITACGLAMQVLLTQGLAAERSNRATAMTYTHMLFAVGFDRFIWGTSLSWVSATGCAMIVAGALWVAIGKQEGASRKGGERRDLDVENAILSAGVEGVPMLGRREEDDTDEILDGRRS